MTVKSTYNAAELAQMLGLPQWKIMEMLRKDLIDHFHTNKNHANCRITHDEYLRILGKQENKKL